MNEEDIKMDGVSSGQTRHGITFLVCSHCVNVERWGIAKDIMTVLAAGFVIASVIVQCWPK